MLSSRKRENIKKKRIDAKKTAILKKRFESVKEVPKSDVIKNLYEKYVQETVLIFLQRQIFPKISKEHCFGCLYDRPSQREHDCVMLDNEQWWDTHYEKAFKLMDFYIIYHLSKNRLYEHFLKSEVEDSIPWFKDPSEYVTSDTWMKQIKDNYLRL